MSDINDFVIENGVLKKYNGSEQIVKIPNNVTSIGDVAFQGCASLTSIEIPNSITSIGSSAFLRCAGLTGVVIPNSVTTIGYAAFWGCTGLTIYCEAESQPSGWNDEWKSSNCPVVWNCKNNDVADNDRIYLVEDGVRYSIYEGKATVEGQSEAITTSNIKEKISYKGNEYTVATIVNDAFRGCTSLTSVVIPNSVTSIGEYAFGYCTGLTSIEISKSVTSIGKNAFWGCTGLTSIEIPDSVTTIGYSAFRGCTSLTSVVIPNSVTSIDICAFYGCTGLTSIEIPDSVSSIDEDVFWGCNDNLVIITSADSYAKRYAKKNRIKVNLI